MPAAASPRMIAGPAPAHGNPGPLSRRLRAPLGLPGVARARGITRPGQEAPSSAQVAPREIRARIGRPTALCAVPRWLHSYHAQLAPGVRDLGIVNATARLRFANDAGIRAPSFYDHGSTQGMMQAHGATCTGPGLDRSASSSHERNGPSRRLGRPPSGGGEGGKQGQQQAEALAGAGGSRAASWRAPRTRSLPRPRPA